MRKYQCTNQKLGVEWYKTLFILIIFLGRRCVQKADFLLKGSNTIEYFRSRLNSNSTVSNEYYKEEESNTIVVYDDVKLFIQPWGVVLDQ